MGVIVESLDGERHELDYLRCTSFVVSSPTPRHDFQYVEDRHGALDMEEVFDIREVRAGFRLQAQDGYDFGLMQNEVFSLFCQNTGFYLIDKYNPQKRWKVRLMDSFSIERVGSFFGKFEVIFMALSVFSESTGTTLDDLTFDAEKWQVGQGLTLEEPKYTHSTNTFSIFNAGDVPVDPREMPIKIIYRGASNNLKITNLTTGDEWQYNGTSKANDNITLDGIRSLKNDASIFKDTNKKLITIAPGWNHFELTGTSGSFLISFEHRFYYY